MDTGKDSLQGNLFRYLQRTRPDFAGRVEEGLAAFLRRPARESFFRLFALVPRWSGKPGDAGCVEVSEALTEVDPILAQAGWGTDQLARLLILSSAQDVWEPGEFARELETLFNTADTGELVALYRSLAFLNEPRQFTARVREGARSNIIPVFLAVAHHNRYPSQYFDEQGWNQLVLKAVFNACPLADIVGLDARNNPTLSHMLADYVRERWAAGRDVPWDIWRCIGPYALEAGDIDLLAQALESDDELTRLASALAVRDGSTEARDLLAGHEELAKTLDNLSWQDLAALAQGD
jgi:hypothetical protein